MGFPRVKSSPLLELRKWIASLPSEALAQSYAHGWSRGYFRALQAHPAVREAAAQVAVTEPVQRTAPVG